MNLPESRFYLSRVAFSNEFQRDVYQLVNRIHNVVEFETPSLPQLFVVIRQFQEILDEELDVQEREAEHGADVVVFPGSNTTQ